MVAKRSARVLPFRLPASKAQAIIRKRAIVTKNVILGWHAKERCLERGISKDDVLRILRLGFVSGEPSKTERGEWKCKVTKQLRGTREAAAITIILHGQALFIKTVEWEDL